MKLIVVLSIFCLIQVAYCKSCGGNQDCGPDECCAAAPYAPRHREGLHRGECTPLAELGDTCAMPSDRLQHRPLVCPCVEGLECIGRRPSKGQPTFLALLYPTGKCVDPNACSSNLDCDENECCAIVGTGFDPPKRCIPLGGEGERCAASYNPERPLGCPCAEGLTCEVTEGAQKTFLSILHPTGRCRQA